MAHKSQEWMTPSEVARMLGVDPETIRRYIRLGQLAANRLPSGHYRIRRVDAEKLLPPQERGPE